MACEIQVTWCFASFTKPMVEIHSWIVSQHVGHLPLPIAIFEEIRDVILEKKKVEGNNTEESHLEG